LSKKVCVLQLKLAGFEGKMVISMKILVIGGTRFFGIHMVNELLADGHDVTIATRGKAYDKYGDRVRRIIVERTSAESMKNAFLVDKDVRGAINGSSEGTISIKEMIEYVERKTGTRAVIDRTGENAPYNGEPEYSINTEKAKALGFRFSVLQDWIYELLDYYIEFVRRTSVCL